MPHGHRLRGELFGRDATSSGGRLDCLQQLALLFQTVDCSTSTINAFEEKDQVIYSITDASHAADHDTSTNGTPLGSRSHSGRILAVGSRTLLETGKGTIHVIEYHSNVLKRVYRKARCKLRLKASSRATKKENTCALSCGA